MKTLRYAAAIAIISGLAFAQPTPPGQKKSPDLGSFAPGSTVQVIVQFNGAPTSAFFSQLSTPAFKGTSQLNQFKHLNAIVLKLPASVANLLATLPITKYISIDRPLKAHLDVTLPTVGADLAHASGYTGQGIGVAVIDSGITPNADLAGRVVYNQNFVPGETTTNDLYGHGTHVAGIIAGSGANAAGSGRNLSGIAPQVNLLNLRVLDENGNGSDSSVIAAIDQAIQLKSQYNVKVINLSLGRPIYESFAT